MVKLAIIDDEYEQVEGIKKFIDWNKYDIEICGVAYNGRDGFSLFQKHKPDIAIVDIQMPHMNGLMLIEEVIKSGQKVQMIILSGHDNFHYAKKAIDLQTNNYLLKPCSAEEILQAVLKAKNQVLEEQNKRDIINEYHTIFTQYKALFKDKLLLDLLNNKLRNPGTFFKDTEKYVIQLSNALCCAVVFRFEDIENIYAHYSNEEFDHLIVKITELIKGKAHCIGHYEVLFKENDLVLIVTDESFDMGNFLHFIHEVHRDLSYSLEYNFVTGIGEIVSSPLAAWKSYRQALAALDNSFLGKNKVILYDSEMFEDTYHFFYPFDNEKKILSSIEIGDLSETKKLVENFFSDFDKSYQSNRIFTKRIGITLLCNIYKYCTDQSLDSTEIDQLINMNFDEIIHAKTFETLKKRIILVLEEIIHHITEHNHLNQLIHTALVYIHTHYSENINLKAVADELCITPAYLSVLFKQETKTNFIDYLNTYRIEMAKNLLKNVQLKNYEIAFQVGFLDEKYFYKLFKKYTGLTPCQYRDSLHALT